MPSVVQLNISPGGMPKLPVPAARITSAGVEGDRHKNLKYHGGLDRAICLFSEELYAELQAEGFAIHPGDIGENFTTGGIDLRALAPGDRLRVGECIIEITKVREPCRQLRIWDEDLPRKILGRSGWMARVVEEGFVKTGDAVERLPRSTL